MWTYKNIPSQEGRTAIVTGSNSGLGFYTARGLAEKGCEVIMACRNTESAEAARADIIGHNKDAKIRVMELDLSDLSSVKGFAESFLSEYPKLDLLINNAGLMAIPYRKTKDGFEMQFGVNHLGHFYLTGLLIQLIMKTKNARIVNVASAAHNVGEIRFEDIHWDHGYKKWKAYGMSKLSNIHFTLELADRIKEHGLEMMATVAHPGYSDSKLIEKGPSMRGRNILVKTGRIVNKLVAQSTEMGALPTLYAATSPDAENGGYYGPSGFAEMRGYPKRVYPNKRKVSKDDQVKLWDLSGELTGLKWSLNSR